MADREELALPRAAEPVEAMNHWQREFLLCQIGTERFAGGVLVADEIEKVIGDLEGEAKVAAEVRQPRRDLRRTRRRRVRRAGRSTRSAPPSSLR